KKGSPAAARKALLERRGLWPGNGVELYRVARELALTAEAVGRDRPELSEDEKRERAGCFDDAMDTLAKAVAAGFRDRAQVEKDEALQGLRQRDEYRKLLAGLKE